MRSLRTLVPLAGSLCALSGNPAAATAGDPGIGVCTASTEVYDDVSGFSSPCATAPGSVLIETTYLQNASAVGGTALAAYPLLTLRTGIARHVEFVLDSPSQIAESGRAGIGLYPKTHLGYGLRYAGGKNERLAFALVTEVLPPMLRFSANHAQARYVLGVTSEYAVNAKLRFGFATSGTSSASAGLAHILPTTVLEAAFFATPAIEISTDLGTRITARRAAAQAFGDVAITETAGRNLAFKLGLGTAFNPVSNTKAHYLAAGVNYSILKI
jgi:hypothetical protein